MRRQREFQRGRPRSGVARWIGGVVVTYAVAAGVWNLLRLTPVSRVGVFELLDIFAVWAYLALPVLALAALLARQWRALTWLLVPVICLLAEYGPPVHARPASSPAARIRVLTSNVAYDDTDVDGLVDVLRREQPDLVALEELSVPLGTAAGERLQADYPYQALYPNGATRGLGLLSRFPLADVSQPEIQDGQCSCFQAKVTFQGQLVAVLVAHPGPPPVDFATLRPLPVPSAFDISRELPELRSAQTKIEAAPHPLLVMGDFNTSDRQPFYRELRRELRDTYREVGPWFGFTYPHSRRLPSLVRIDYIWHDAAWQPLAAWTGVLPASDHRYVVADLALQP